MALSIPHIAFLDELKAGQATDPTFQELHDKLLANHASCLGVYFAEWADFQA